MLVVFQRLWLRRRWSIEIHRMPIRFDEAANSFREGVELDPDSEDLANAFREAVEAGKKFHGTNRFTNARQRRKKRD
ncbi:hypothetical protein RHSIM_Rhsim05G0163100 [Rhododendron simsii]|uniref:Uncharacterized protein n=1 Tax=Rhododendron simsii TaxID=118357 RepID=A0A834GZY5_RHOSS|nr:hypothetical protein RHSIM_Rhsim05G0163100 [Rhododendron simsii]